MHCPSFLICAGSRLRRSRALAASGRRRCAAVASWPADGQAAPARAARRPHHAAGRRGARTRRRGAHPVQPRRRDRRHRHVRRRLRLQLRRCRRRWSCASGLALGVGPARRRARRRNTDRGVGAHDVLRRAVHQNTGIRVIHPQVDASSPLRRRRSTSPPGWAADAVSGATPAMFDTVSTRDQVQRHAPPGARRPRLPSPRRRHLGRGTPTAGRATTIVRRSRSPRTTISTSTTSRWALAYSHNWDSVCDANNSGGASLPLDRIALTSSAHCFTARPAYAAAAS